MIKLLLPMLLALAASAAHAQVPAHLPVVAAPDQLLGQAGGVRYYDQNWLPLTGPSGAYGYDVYRHLNDSLELKWQRRRYVLASGRLVLEQYFASTVPGPSAGLEGLGREWYESGQLREEIYYHNHHLAGTLRTFHPNGRLRLNQINYLGGVVACYDSAGRALVDCPEYYVHAQAKGRHAPVAKLPDLVQRQYAALLPAGYAAPTAAPPVYYAFRIDTTGTVRDARLLTPAAPPVAAAILQAIAQLPAFEPAQLEGKPTNRIVEGKVMVKAGR
ncbi:MAG TPA: hypothetical protein VFO93_11295 [Hymenobacter sp.]|uniref:toxin-antitoxin system YwqK family antitoxin n=1 Tax=Hymenobacter sp. TaxID=1898978 RepID=UPI002D809C83|nr:hypothetical protein [Hymenobacter sp.]HET9504120.1 hypothetical protein [Hymenobacter sp.]